MVASPERERPQGQGNDYLVNKIAELERRLDQLSAQSKFPFAVMRNGNKEFSIEYSEDGSTTDLIIGNGIGGISFESFTSLLYGGKGWHLLDYSGNEILASDTSAGYGLGVPCLAFNYAGFESLNMNGATSPATATVIAQGGQFVYNPSLLIQPRVRWTASTALTINMFMETSVVSGTYTTTERVQAISAGGIALLTPAFIELFTSADIKNNCDMRIKAYCSSGVGANASVTVTYNRGFGASKAYYDINTAAQ